MASQTRKTKNTARTRESVEKAIKRVAGYTRVSTDDQAETGLGLAAQESKIQLMASMKDWTQAVCMYTDAGITGTSAKRPDYQRLQDDIRAGNIDAVIVASLDRIGRKSDIVLNFAQLCETHNVLLISIKENFDTSTPTGKFVLQMFAALSELEVNTIKERTIAALDERGNLYDYKAGMLPLGYIRIVNDGNEYIAIDDSTISIVRSIFDMTRRGKSAEYIAKSLNNRGIQSRKGKQWYASSVRVILDNKPIYRGEYQAYPRILP